MNKIANRQVICEVLMEHAKEDRDVVVLCSDSRGSASLAPFASAFPEQFVEVGIAEQNLVSISAGMAKCGKKPYAASPASFISTRSFEQAKVDVAYSNTNVKLIGISGGVSYGALGMSHHSAQDIAAFASVPNMRVYLPSDRFQTRHLMEALLEDHCLRRNGKTCHGCGQNPEGKGNQRLCGGYVLCKAFGRGNGNPGSIRGKGRRHRGGTCALRRPGFHGKPGGCRGMPEKSG